MRQICNETCFFFSFCIVVEFVFLLWDVVHLTLSICNMQCRFFCRLFCIGSMWTDKRERERERVLTFLSTVTENCVSLNVENFRASKLTFWPCRIEKYPSKIFFSMKNFVNAQKKVASICTSLAAHKKKLKMRIE